MARPKKPPHLKQDRELRIKITAEMQVLLNATAEHAGQSLSDWVRTRLLDAARREGAAAVEPGSEKS